MIRIKVHYDPVSRTFKLVDPEFKTLLEGDVLYDLNVPIMYEDAEVDTLIAAANTVLAHA